MTTRSVTLMSGAGNDFVVLEGDAAVAFGDALPGWIRRITRRGLSVGSDGVLVVEALGGDRVRVVFYNPDGGRAFCGNGSRCAARFAHERGMSAAELVLETDAGDVPARVDGASVRLELPPPVDRGPVEIDLDGRATGARLVVAGVPHLVIPCDAPCEAPLERWAPPLRRDPRFGPEGVNVDLLGVGTPMPLRTWERGVEGETLACGSGAVAAAFAARLDGASERITLLPAGGLPLTVELPGPPDAPRCARLEGEARWIGELRLSPDATAIPDRDG